MINYDCLWETMKEKGITQYSLIKDYHINESQLHRLRKNMVIKTSTINRLCEILDCEVGDICQYFYLAKLRRTIYPLVSGILNHL